MNLTSFAEYASSKFPWIATPVVKTKMAQKLKDARVGTTSCKSLNARLEDLAGADATQRTDPPLPMLQFDEEA